MTKNQTHFLLMYFMKCIHKSFSDKYKKSARAFSGVFYFKVQHYGKFAYVLVVPHFNFFFKYKEIGGQKYNIRLIFIVLYAFLRLFYMLVNHCAIYYIKASEKMHCCFLLDFWCHVFSSYFIKYSNDKIWGQILRIKKQ